MLAMLEAGAMRSHVLGVREVAMSHRDGTSCGPLLFWPILEGWNHPEFPP